MGHGIVGKSSRRGEVDRPRVTVCRTPEEVKTSLHRKPGAMDYLINAAVDALGEAAEKDVRLAVRRAIKPSGESRNRRSTN